MNNFYGKPLNRLTPQELVLLSLDIDIMNGKKNNVVDSDVMKFLYQTRLGIVLTCFQCGGDYSIIRFEREFENGHTHDEVETEITILEDYKPCLN